MPEDHPRAAHRTSSAVITLIDRAGVPLAHHDVVVRQRTHEFGFGCIGFDLIPLANGDRGASLVAPAGRIDVTGFRGDYVIDAGGESAQFALGPAAAMDVRLGTEGRGGR